MVPPCRVWQTPKKHHPKNCLAGFEKIAGLNPLGGIPLIFRKNTKPQLARPKLGTGIFSLTKSPFGFNVIFGKHWMKSIMYWFKQIRNAEDKAA